MNYIFSRKYTILYVSKIIFYYIHKFMVLMSLLFNFLIIFKKLIVLLTNSTHQVLFNLELICLKKKKLKNISFM